MSDHSSLSLTLDNNQHHALQLLMTVSLSLIIPPFCKIRKCSSVYMKLIIFKAFVITRSYSDNIQSLIQGL